MARIAIAVTAILGVACGQGPDQPGSDGGGGGDGGGFFGDGGGPPFSDALDTATGCPGVYNPDQMLELSFEMASGDWNTILADLTYSTYVTAQMSCNGEPAITVGVRRKRSGGAMKVGLKVDVDFAIANQNFHGLKKLSLENGVSSGDNTDSADARDYMAEYLGWRLMVQSGAVTGRAAFVLVRVNGAVVGVYVNVEQPDKRFLANRLGENDGWLYKKSGGVDDGFKTHELDGLDDPYDDWFCFWASSPCPVPAADVLAAELPGRLHIDQMLRVGAVNAIMANTDSIFFKDNNYYWYDSAPGRLYFAWDLDTSMNGSTDVITGGGGGQTAMYTDVLFSHWLADYRRILGELIGERLTAAVITSEIDRAESVSASGFEVDPYVTGSAASAGDTLRGWWSARIPEVQAQLQ